MRSVVKAVMALVLFCFAIAVVVSNTSGRLYPAVVIILAGASLSTAALALTAPLDRTSSTTVIVFLSCVAVAVRLLVFALPAGIVGLDILGNIHRVSNLAAASSISGMDVLFYSKAPFHHVLTYEFKLISSLPISDSFLIWPIIAGSVIVLGVSQISRYLAERDLHRSAVLGATLAATAALGMHFGFQPIPQTLAVAYMIVMTMSVIRYVREIDIRQLLLVFLFWLALAYTHKLPMLLLAAIFSTVVATYTVVSFYQESDSSLRLKAFISRWYYLVLLSGVVLFLQWQYITDYLPVIMVKLSLLLQGLDTIGGTAPSYNQFRAVQPLSQPIRFLFYRGHGLVLLLLSSIAGLSLLRQSKTKSRIIIVGYATAFVPLMVIAVLSPKALPNLRTLFYAEFVLIPIVAAWLIELDCSTIDRRMVTSVLLVVFVLSQATSPLIAPDAPGQPRLYLTEQEKTGEEFTKQYVNGQVFADTYYTLRDVDRGCDPCSIEFVRNERALLTGTVVEKGYPYILYRGNARIYWYRHYPSLRLTWNERQTYDRSYNRVYSTGSVILYSESVLIGATTPENLSTIGPTRSVTAPQSSVGLTDG